VTALGPTALLIFYCVLILLASLAGGWIPLLVRLTHQRMQLAISLVAGFMFGVALLHMMPHALAESGSDERVMLWVLAGFLVMFFLERFFCFHHHDTPGVGESEGQRNGHAHTDHHDHDHKLAWSGAAVGLTLHSLLAGIALAAATQKAQATEPGHAAWAGVAVFFVIIFHKPLDSMTLGTLMAAGGWSVRARHLVNALFALAIPVGAMTFHVGAAVLSESEGAIGPALAFSAGVFMCIAMSDLLPELQFHQHDRIKLSIALLLGLALAWSIGQLESHMHVPGEHDHAQPRPAETRDADQTGNDHHRH